MRRTLAVLVVCLFLSQAVSAQFVRTLATDPSTTNPSSSTWADTSTLGGGVPAGMMTFVLSGACPVGWTEVMVLSGKTLYGTLAANKDVGNAVGADSITPAGTNGTAAFTPAGTNGTGTVTPLGTVAWPAGVPTFSGTAGAMAAHTISWPAGVPTFSGTQSTTVVNHLHTLATGIGATGNFSQVIGTVDTSSGGTGGTPTQTALGTLSGNPTAGGAANYTPAGTVAWPAGVPTENTPNFTPVGTVAWPAGVPTLSGSSSVTSAQVFTGTQGTVPAQAFTGTAFDNRSAGIKVIFCSKD